MSREMPQHDDRTLARVLVDLDTLSAFFAGIEALTYNIEIDAPELDHATALAKQGQDLCEAARTRVEAFQGTLTAAELSTQQ
jgi:hypothetical protein